MIDRFDGKHAFLSNFHPSPVKLYGLNYQTVEHAFQAAKTLDLSEREAIRLAPTPGRAKRLGRRATLRPDWEDLKVGFMETLLRRKFADPHLHALLRATAPLELVEGNTWGDDFWGAVPFGTVWTGSDHHRWVGQNHLGRLLMEIRDDEDFGPCD